MKEWQDLQKSIDQITSELIHLNSVVEKLTAEHVKAIGKLKEAERMNNLLRTENEALAETVQTLH